MLSPKGVLVVILFKQCSLFELLMCSSFIYGKSFRRCIVTIVIGLRDLPKGVSVALLCFLLLDARLLKD